MKNIVGILALQGDFLEHYNALKNLGVKVIFVKNVQDLKKIDRLIMPGGESSAIGIIAEKNGLLKELRKFVKSNKPVWGTCAGLILLADRVSGQKIGGQPFVSGLDIMVERNFYGSQKQSFEENLNAPKISNTLINVMFIRAPAITKIGRKVETLATIKYDSKNYPVAIQQKNILATTFHSEINGKNKFSEYFLSI